MFEKTSGVSPLVFLFPTNRSPLEPNHLHDMKPYTLYTSVVLLALLSIGSAFAITINVNPGDDLVAAVESASPGDIVLLAAGTYPNVKRIGTPKHVTVMGAPFVNSNNDPAMIEAVTVQFKTNVANNFEILDGATIRGIKFTGGDNQLACDGEMRVEYCIFEEGNDHISFNQRGYGKVAHCRFYNSADDGIDINYKDIVPGAYFDIHHNYFEGTGEDGIEFSVKERRNWTERLTMAFHHNHFYNCGTNQVAGGDAIQLIDQSAEESQVSAIESRTILIYNNVFDGNNLSRNGIGCNLRDSKAQINSIGSTTLDEPIWIWNNTFTRFTSAGIAGAERCWAINNIVMDSPLGFVRCDARNNLTYNVPTPLGTAAIDGGDNAFGQDPGINPLSLELTPNGFAIDAGLISAQLGDAGHSLLIEPDFLGHAPDLGALESSGTATNMPPRFTRRQLTRPRVLVNTALTNSVLADVYETDGDILAFAIEGPAWLTIDDNGTLNGTPASNDLGENEWTLTVSDKDGSATATLKLLVWDGTVPPLVARAGEDQTVHAEFNGTYTLTLDGTASSGDIVEYLWMLNGAPLKTGAVTEHTFPIGTHSITLQLTDYLGHTASDEIVITIEPYDTGMVANAGEDQIHIVPAGGSIRATLDASGSIYDPAKLADKKRFLWKERFADGTTKNQGETLEINPTFNVGAHDLVFRIKDSAGNVVRDDVMVYVIETGSDVDGDGMEDIWEYTHYGDMSAKGTTDFDLDGMVDADEFIAGTDPSDPTSLFTIASGVSHGNSIIQWDAVEGRTYKVLGSSSLTNRFSTLAEGLDYPKGAYTGAVEQAAFYKVEVSIK